MSAGRRESGGAAPRAPASGPDGAGGPDGARGRSRRIVVVRYGGPEEMRLVEGPTPVPGPGEVRVRRTAAGAGSADVLMAEGACPDGPRPPFTPGHDLVGTVDAVGEGVTGFALGQPVAALTVYGAYADHVCVPASRLVPMPPGLDPAEAVTLVLDYLAAYQMLHRAARVGKGERVLVHDAACGVGSAALELGRIAGLVDVYGTVAGGAAVRAVAALGGVPIDLTRENFASRVRIGTSRGLDVVLDGTGGWTSPRSYRLLGPGGRLVLYGRAAHRPAVPLVLARAAFHGTRRVVAYRAARLRERRPDWYREDLGALFGLLAERRIAPVIAERAPLEDASGLHERLRRSEAAGRRVLC
ncbi:alcohol dehydrogenase catalytic domain-containing protein [Actinomadura viridis]|uniref:alcohol dehydrogenase catalytic domain-containing protein n=1 Tax=Actinomadura viridis TaxID=58110 RepID=UPI0036BF763E